MRRIKSVQVRDQYTPVSYTHLPAGTGMKCYSNIKLDTDLAEDEEEYDEDELELAEALDVLPAEDEEEVLQLTDEVDEVELSEEEEEAELTEE